MVNVQAFGWLVAETLADTKGCLWLAETIKQADQPCVSQTDQEFLAYLGGSANSGILPSEKQEARLCQIKNSLQLVWPLWEKSDERQELLAKLETASKHYKTLKLA